MREDVLISIKRDFENLQNQQKKFEEIWNRIEELENREDVVEYLKLKSLVSNVKTGRRFLNSDEMLEISFRGNMMHMDETNEIYVCLGIFCLTRNINCGKSKEIYKRYVNVENQFDSVLIPISDAFDFEREHLVVFPKKNGYDGYHEVQMDFIKTSVCEGQGNACKKILSKKY